MDMDVVFGTIMLVALGLPALIIAFLVFAMLFAIPPTLIGAAAGWVAKQAMKKG